MHSVLVVWLTFLSLFDFGEKKGKTPYFRSTKVQDNSEVRVSIETNMTGKGKFYNNVS